MKSLLFLFDRTQSRVCRCCVHILKPRQGL